MIKIMELYFDPDGEEEQYKIELPEGISKLQAAAHMFRATAEGLFELQEILQAFLRRNEEGGGMEYKSGCEIVKCPLLKAIMEIERKIWERGGK